MPQGKSEKEKKARDEAREEFYKDVSEEDIKDAGLVGYSPQSRREPLPEAKIVTAIGVVGLNASAIRTVAQTLRDNMEKNPELKRQFFQNPRAVLGSVGLNEEIQNELLSTEADFGRSPFYHSRLAAWCITTQCCCTSCCLTCWFSL